MTQKNDAKPADQVELEAALNNGAQDEESQREETDAEQQASSGSASGDQQQGDPNPNPEQHEPPVSGDDQNTEEKDSEIPAAIEEEPEATDGQMTADQQHAHALLDQIHNLTHHMTRWFELERGNWAVKEIKARIAELRELI